MQLAGEAELASKAHVQVTEHNEGLAQVSMIERAAVSSRLQRSAGSERQEETHREAGGQVGEGCRTERSRRPEFGEENTEDSTLSIMRHPALCP